MSKDILIGENITSIDETKHDDTSKLRYTCIFIDYDDTCLCTTYLANLGYTLITKSPEKGIILYTELRQLAKAVGRFIELAMQLGEVTIVTNADKGWVELSARCFIPEIVPLLNMVTIVSARACYDKVYPDSWMWKYSVFRNTLGLAPDMTLPKLPTTTDNSHDCLLSDEDDLIRDFVKTLTQGIHYNVISIGDGLDEKKAVQQLSDAPNILVKSIKLKKQPTCIELYAQIDMLISRLTSIVASRQPVDLFFYIENLDGKTLIPSSIDGI